MSTTQHPLTEIAAAEVPDEMVLAALNAYVDDEMTGLGGFFEDEPRRMRAALSAAFAVATTADPHHDPRPWEPLNGGRIYVGDEVRQDLCNVTVIAVVGEVDEEGDPRTAEGRLIGLLRHGTWWVRRPVQELPTEDGAVIVPADGCDYIETRNGKTPRRLTWDAESYVWYDARGTHLDADITPGTWKVYGE